MNSDDLNCKSLKTNDGERPMYEMPIERLKIHPLNMEIYGKDGGPNLVESIKKNGILSPLMISYKNEIISGSRRFYAAQKAGLSEVPVHIFETQSR